jgi:hypothetical protein
MSILEALESHKKKATKESGDFMDHVVFENALIELDVDRETIDECMEESPSLWDSFLNYFQYKANKK